jgi:hypothetical protein
VFVCTASSTDSGSWSLCLFVQQVVQTVGAGTGICLYSKYRQWELEPGFVCTASTDIGAGTRVCLYSTGKFKQWELETGFVCTESTENGSWNQGLFLQQVQTVGARTRVCLYSK